jgi:deoxyuridine 5'-triphosphate nucleotidohydrolase
MKTPHTLEFFKCRYVKSPTKHGVAAGFDFFVPDDLTIKQMCDKIISSGCYLNEWTCNKPQASGFVVPIIFEVLIDNVAQRYNAIIFELSEGGYTYHVSKEMSLLNIFDFFKGEKIADDLEYRILNTPMISMEVGSNASVLIPSGIHVKLPENVFLNAENKSGIASKRGLIKGAQTIDNDYQGEIHINLYNVNRYPVKIYPGEKIIQFVPYFQPIMSEVKEYFSKDALYADTNSERGEGGFGSSGLK